jgi:hypothetical protein
MPQHLTHHIPSVDNSIYYTDTGRLFQNCGNSKCVQKVSKPDHRCDSNSSNSTSRVHFHAYCDPPLRLPGVNCIELKEIPKKQSWCSGTFMKSCFQ